MILKGSWLLVLKGSWLFVLRKVASWGVPNYFGSQDAPFGIKAGAQDYSFIRLFVIIRLFVYSLSFVYSFIRFAVFGERTPRR